MSRISASQLRTITTQIDSEQKQAQDKLDAARKDLFKRSGKTAPNRAALTSIENASSRIRGAYSFFKTALKDGIISLDDAKKIQTTIKTAVKDANIDSTEMRTILVSLDKAYSQDKNNSNQSVKQHALEVKAFFDVYGAGPVPK